MELVQPPLADLHRASGARLGAFAGWEMPISHAGAVAEHTAVRDDVGVFDVSHLGTVFVTGPGATATVDGAFTNAAATLTDGRSQYTLCATPSGGVTDDLIVYRLAGERWLAVPNGANTAAVVARLHEVGAAVGEDVEVEDASRGWAVLAVQGPRALALAGEVVGGDPASLGFGDVVELADGGVLCRTGYTGEQGVELVVPGAQAPAFWEALVAGGAAPCGLAARDTLRLEMGYPLHGNELGPEVSPYEARSGWAVKLDGRSFVGRDALAAAKQAGPSRRLWGLLADGRRPPRAGMVVSHHGEQVGTVTSGSFSPTLGHGIGLALLDASLADGDTVDVDVRGTAVPYTVTRPPMVDRSPH